MVNQTENKHASLRKHAFGMIAGLILQYLLGLVVTFFVHFPETGSPQTLWEFARTQIPVILHIILGFLLLFGSIALLVRSFVYKDKTWEIASVVNLIAVLGAIAAGAVFVPSQSDTYSFVMAVAFIVALLSLMWGAYASKKS